jgi:hypothetical protein
MEHSMSTTDFPDLPDLSGMFPSPEWYQAQCERLRQRLTPLILQVLKRDINAEPMTDKDLFAFFARRYGWTVETCRHTADCDLMAFLEEELKHELRMRAADPPQQVAEAAAPEFLSVSDLAGLLHLSVDQVDAFLRRYRKKYPDCCIETEGRRKNDPKYLYRSADVLPVLEQRFQTPKVTGK